MTLKDLVRYAERFLKLIGIVKHKRDQVNAQRSSGVKIKKIEYAGKADVYNMSVEKHHNFLINGGFVTHNCDALRYYANTVIRIIPGVRR